MPKLTDAQQRTLDMIKAHGYALSMYFTNSYSCHGTRIRYDMIRRLRTLKLLKGVAVRPGETVAGFTNTSKVSQHIVVSVDNPTGV